MFPNWDPFPWDADPCAVCDVLVSESKADKQAIRKKAENEKVSQKFPFEARK